jgi:hypothetical protein
MAVLESQTYDLTVLAGQTFSQQFDCFQDDALSVVFDLTGYTFQAVLKIPNLGEDPAVTLTESSGLAVSPSQGIVSLTVAAAVTATWPVGRGRWYLQATDSSGEVSYPLRGVLYVGNP